MYQRLLVGSLVLLSILLMSFRNSKRKLTGSDPVRGIRNNNPGNIRLTNDRWVGQVDGDDKEFVTFDQMENGARAQMIVLRNYIRNGFNTIEKITKRYSPPSDNNPTEELIKVYSTRLGVRPNQVLAANESNLKNLGYEIGRVETANHKAITRNLYDEAFLLI